MKKNYKILLAALLFPVCLFAQSNFKPGYVVTIQGDTLKGSVNYKEWYYNPSSVDFKDNAGQTVIYSKSNAKAFGIDGLDYYQLFTLPLSMDEADINKVPNAYSSVTKTQTVFLRVITKGQFLTLYSFTDDLKTRFIITDTKTGQAQELSHHFYIDAAQKKLMEINRYRIELTSYADTYDKNSATLASTIEKSRFDKKSISKIVNIINGEDSKKQVATDSKSPVRFFAGAALNGSRLTYRYDTDLDINPQSHTDFFPQVNFGFDCFINPNVGRWVLRGEINLYSANMKAISPTAVKEVQSFTVNAHPQIIYNVYNTLPLKVFVGTGLLAHFSFYTKNVYTLSNPQATNADIKYQPTTVWLALPVKAGIVLNSAVEIYGAYNLPANIDDVAFLRPSGRIESYQLGINYLFGKKK